MTPDFSMYTEMPTALQLYNCFRNRWVGAFLQSKGVTVLPTVRWGDLESFNYCFDGIEKGCIVAVSTVGLRNDKANFLLGYNEMFRRIHPEAVICYGKPFEEMKGRIIAVDYAETNRLGKNCCVQTVCGHTESVCIPKGGGSAGGASSGNPIIFNEETDMPGFPGWENKAPGKDFEWKGNSDIDRNQGSWYNPKTKEKYYYDINHPDGKQPHWDYKNRNGWDKGYRIFPDGSWERKVLELEEIDYVRK